MAFTARALTAASAFATAFSQYRIIGGVEVLDAIPSVALLDFRPDLEDFCGATVVGKRHLVTAAHCSMAVKNWGTLDGFVARLGLANRTGHSFFEERVDVEDHELHSSFRSGAFDNDIAVVRLKVEVADTFARRKAVVADQCYFDALREGTTLDICGFGLTQEKVYTSQSDVLRCAQVDLVHNSDSCSRLMSRAGVSGELQFCAGGDGRDACQGDSGGSITYVDKLGTRVMVGVTSWGSGCGRIGVPGVYERVGVHMDWLFSMVDDLAITTMHSLLNVRTSHRTDDAASFLDSTEGDVSGTTDALEVVALIRDKTGRVLAEGVVLGPSLVLTSAASVGLKASAHHVCVNATRRSDCWRCASRKLALVGGVRILDRDVAVVDLAAPLPRSLLAATRVRRIALGDRILPDANIEACGFGIAEAGNTKVQCMRNLTLSQDNVVGLKRGEFRIEGVAPFFGDCTSGVVGSPLFVLDGDGQRTLVGLRSCGQPTSATGNGWASSFFRRICPTLVSGANIPDLDFVRVGVGAADVRACVEAWPLRGGSPLEGAGVDGFDAFAQSSSIEEIHGGSAAEHRAVIVVAAAILSMAASAAI